MDAVDLVSEVVERVRRLVPARASPRRGGREGRGMSVGKAGCSVKKSAAKNPVLSVKARRTVECYNRARARGVGGWAPWRWEWAQRIGVCRRCAGEKPVNRCWWCDGCRPLVQKLMRAGYSMVQVAAHRDRKGRPEDFDVAGTEHTRELAFARAEIGSVLGRSRSSWVSFRDPGAAGRRKPGRRTQGASDDEHGQSRY